MSAEPTTFDPSRYLTQISGRDYLEVKWRLLWLRTLHPDAVIETELVRDDGATALFRARVSIPGGGSATGWGSESYQDFGDYVEKAECVPLRSEILTREGFKSFDAVRVGEDVLAYDVETDQTVWTPLQQVSVFPRGHVVALENSAGWRIECTDDHSWAIQRHTYAQMQPTKVRELRQARRLKTSDSIILAAPAPGGDHPLTPPEAAILGWLVTDGHIKGDGRGMIAQAKLQHVAAIRELVGTMAKEYTIPAGVRTFPTGKTYQTRESYQWHIPTSVLRPLLTKAGITTLDDLPKLVTQLSTEARAAMLDAFMAAEGDVRGNFAQKAGPVLDAFQILATLEGKALAPRRRASFGGIFVQRLKKRRHLCVSEVTMTEVGDLPVWCPTTAYGTWVMRQDGLVTITGNTKALGRALAALGYGTQFCQDFDFGAAERGRVVDSPVDISRVRGHGRPGAEQAGAGAARAARGGDPATARQVKAIYAIGRAGHLADADIVRRSQEQYGCPPEQLDRRDASNFIDWLKQEMAAGATPTSA
jgi:hypothetical protein